MSLPAELKLRQGWTRYILRVAMDGILPPAIQWRPGKANLTAYFNQGLAEKDSRLLAELHSGSAARLAPYIDWETLQAGEITSSSFWLAMTLAAWFAAGSIIVSDRFHIPIAGGFGATANTSVIVATGERLQGRISDGMVRFGMPCPRRQNVGSQRCHTDCFPECAIPLRMISSMHVVRASERPKQQELALLLLCARTQVDDDIAGRMRALIAEGISWQVFYELAQQHGLISLCLRSLQRVDAGGVPQVVMDGLRASVQQMTWHGLLLLGELCKLMALFNTHALQAIPFKGPTLSALAYGDPVLRVYGDLDILVPKQEVPQATQLLETSGYIPHGTRDGWVWTDADSHPHSHHALFKHPVTDVVVELHWKVDEHEFIRPMMRSLPPCLP